MTATMPTEPTIPAVRSDGSAMVEPEERERRLLLLAEALLDGRAHRELVETAVQTWGVSRRTAQVYAQEVEERLRAEAHHLPPLFALELSQMQRSRFLRKLVERTRGSGELSPRDYCTIVSTANRLLDSRDRSAARMLEHQQRQRSAQEDAIISNFTNQVRELAEREKGGQKCQETPTQSESPVRAEPVSSLTPAGPSSAEPEEEEDLSEDFDETQLSEDEKAELRDLEEVIAEGCRASPAERAGWQAEARQYAAAAGWPWAGGKPQRASPGDPTSLRAAPAPGASHVSSPIARRQTDLRAERKRRRQERKRLRRQRKRTRGPPRRGSV